VKENARPRVVFQAVLGNNVIVREVKRDTFFVYSECVVFDNAVFRAREEDTVNIVFENEVLHSDVVALHEAQEPENVVLVYHEVVLPDQIEDRFAVHEVCVVNVMDKVTHSITLYTEVMRVVIHRVARDNSIFGGVEADTSSRIFHGVVRNNVVLRRTEKDAGLKTGRKRASLNKASNVATPCVLNRITGQGVVVREVEEDARSRVVFQSVVRNDVVIRVVEVDANKGVLGDNIFYSAVVSKSKHDRFDR